MVMFSVLVDRKFFLNKGFSITPYQIPNKRKPNVKFFHVFGLRLFIYNRKEYHNKCDVKVNEGIFFRTLLNSKAFCVLNKKSKRIEESYYITFDDKFIKNSQQHTKVLSDEILPSSNTQTLSSYDSF